MATQIDFPAELQIDLLIVNDETGQSGNVVITVGRGEIRTLEEVRQRIEKFRDEELQKLAPGFRVASNREFWDSQSLKHFGQIVAVAGQSFGSDIEGSEGCNIFLRQRHAEIDEDDE